jgi:hypothetical protein
MLCLFRTSVPSTDGDGGCSCLVLKVTTMSHQGLSSFSETALPELVFVL